MSDWNKFLKDTQSDENGNKDIDKYENIDDRIQLSAADFKGFCDRLSGESEHYAGECKSVISYQSYDMGADKDAGKDIRSETIYNINRAVASISYDELHPDLALVSIKFKSFDDPELRLFWARIQKWRNSLSKPATDGHIPIFLLYLLEKESLGNMDDNSKDFGILSAEIVNPLLCYITRETPTMEASDIINEKDEHIGGNVIKLLCSTDFITFTIRDDIDVRTIKAEVQRQLEEERYINASDDVRQYR